MDRGHEIIERLGVNGSQTNSALDPNNYRGISARQVINDHAQRLAEKRVDNAISLPIDMTNHELERLNETISPLVAIPSEAAIKKGKFSEHPIPFAQMYIAQQYLDEFTKEEIGGNMYTQNENADQFHQTCMLMDGREEYRVSKALLSSANFNKRLNNYLHKTGCTEGAQHCYRKTEKLACNNVCFWLDMKSLFSMFERKSVTMLKAAMIFPKGLNEGMTTHDPTNGINFVVEGNRAIMSFVNAQCLPYVQDLSTWQEYLKAGVKDGSEHGYHFNLLFEHYKTIGITHLVNITKVHREVQVTRITNPDPQNVYLPNWIPIIAELSDKLKMNWLRNVILTPQALANTFSKLEKFKIPKGLLSEIDVFLLNRKDDQVDRQNAGAILASKLYKIAVGSFEIQKGHTMHLRDLGDLVTILLLRSFIARTRQTKLVGYGVKNILQNEGEEYGMFDSARILLQDFGIEISQIRRLRLAKFAHAVMGTHMVHELLKDFILNVEVPVHEVYTQFAKAHSITVTEVPLVRPIVLEPSQEGNCYKESVERIGGKTDLENWPLEAECEDEADEAGYFDHGLTIEDGHVNITSTTDQFCQHLTSKNLLVEDEEGIKYDTDNWANKRWHRNVGKGNYHKTTKGMKILGERNYEISCIEEIILMLVLLSVSFTLWMYGQYLMALSLLHPMMLHYYWESPKLNYLWFATPLALFNPLVTVVPLFATLIRYMIEYMLPAPVLINMCAGPGNDETHWQRKRRWNVKHCYDMRYFQNRILPNYGDKHSIEFDLNVLCEECVYNNLGSHVFADLGSELPLCYLPLFYAKALRNIRHILAQRAPLTKMNKVGMWLFAWTRLAPRAVVKIQNFSKIMSEGQNDTLLRELGNWKVLECDELQANEVYVTSWNAEDSVNATEMFDKKPEPLPYPEEEKVEETWDAQAAKIVTPEGRLVKKIKRRPTRKAPPAPVAKQVEHAVSLRPNGQRKTPLLPTPVTPPLPPPIFTVPKQVDVNASRYLNGAEEHQGTTFDGKRDWILRATDQEIFAPSSAGIFNTTVTRKTKFQSDEILSAGVARAWVGLDKAKYFLRSEVFELIEHFDRADIANSGIKQIFDLHTTDEFKALPFDGIVTSQLNNRVVGPSYEEPEHFWCDATVNFHKVIDSVTFWLRSLRTEKNDHYKELHNGIAKQVGKWLPTNKDIDFKLMEGTYGCGKSYLLKKKIDEIDPEKKSSLVVCTTSKLAREYKFAGYQAASWSTAFTMLDGIENIFIDEIFLFDPRPLAYFMTHAKKVFAVGDRRQMKPELPLVSFDLHDKITPVKRLEVTRSSPLDIVAHLNRSEPTITTTRSRVLNSVVVNHDHKQTIKQSQCAVGCKKEHEHKVVICFDKQHAAQNSWSTVATIQGLRRKEINLIFTANAKQLIERVNGQLLVALTRHTNRINVCCGQSSRGLAVKHTPLPLLSLPQSARVGARDKFHTIKGNSEAITTDIIVKNTPKIAAMSAKGHVVVAKGRNRQELIADIAEQTGEDVTVAVPREYALNADRHGGITQHYTPMQEEHFEQVLNVDGDLRRLPEEMIDTVHMVSVPQNAPLEASMALSRVAPNCSTMAHNSRSTNICYNRGLKEGKRMVVKTADILTTSENMTTVGLCSQLFATKQTNLPNHRLATTVERYGRVEGHAMGSREVLEEAERLKEGFSKFVNISALRSPDSDELEMRRTQALLRAATKKTQTATGIWGEEYGTSEKIKCFNKVQLKSKVGENAFMNAKEENEEIYIKGGQMVSAQAKEVNQIVAPWVNWAEYIVTASLEPGVFFGYGQSPRVLNDRFKARNNGDDNEKKVMSVDISEQDTTKHEPHDIFMRWIYEKCGVPSQVVDIMEFPNKKWSMDNKTASIKVKNQFQSGRADTIFANTCHVTAEVGAAFKIEGRVIVAVQGDDCLVVADEIDRTDFTFPNLKIDMNPVGEFVSFLYSNGEIYLDLVRVATKVLSRDVVSNDRREQLKQAVKDTLSLNRSLHRERLNAYVVSAKYQMPLGEVFMVLDFLKSYALRGDTFNLDNMKSKGAIQVLMKTTTQEFPVKRVGAPKRKHDFWGADLNTIVDEIELAAEVKQKKKEEKAALEKRMVKREYIANKNKNNRNRKEIQAKKKLIARIAKSTKPAANTRPVSYANTLEGFAAFFRGFAIMTSGLFIFSVAALLNETVTTMLKIMFLRFKFWQPFYALFATIGVAAPVIEEFLAFSPMIKIAFAYFEFMSKAQTQPIVIGMYLAAAMHLINAGLLHKYGFKLSLLPRLCVHIGWNLSIVFSVMNMVKDSDFFEGYKQAVQAVPDHLLDSILEQRCADNQTADAVARWVREMASQLFTPNEGPWLTRCEK